MMDGGAVNSEPVERRKYVVHSGNKRKKKKKKKGEPRSTEHMTTGELVIYAIKYGET